MKNNEINLEPGMVVQLDPIETKNAAFAGCLMVVTEPKGFGCQGYVQSLGKDREMGGQAYYRANWEEFEYVGKAFWVVE